MSASPASPTPDGPLVAIEHVTKRYGRVTAVSDVTLAIERGEVLGLLGPNGSGKTTLLRVLTGYLSPSAGRIVVAGHDVTRQPMEARRSIGYVPESLPLYAHMRVREFLSFMARLRGLDRRQVAPALAEVSEQVRLDEVMSAPIRTLSRGYRQRVAIAQALVHHPDVLILDEPTNGLDPGQIDEMLGFIRSLAPNRTIILSTHILAQVVAVCEKVVIVSDGRVVVEDLLATLTRDQRLDEAYKQAIAGNLARGAA
jgi:ABC-2 type transport system ATP-binding protein